MRFRLAIVLLLMVTRVQFAAACIWDYDTLRDEQRGLPGVAEVLAGRYERRSPFFYADRITRMQKLLASDPNNQDAIDNLAVALFRKGQPDRAIELLNDKEKRFPNQYTTSSNLATFDMLTGHNELAIPLLEKALRINPKAHFGREKYQLELAKLLAHKQARPSTRPFDSAEDFLTRSPFWDEYGTADDISPDPHLIHRNWSGPGASTPEEQAAIDAIVGMIRYGTDQSPDLFYALGNLLLTRGDRNLAIRAYQRAADLHHPLTKAIQAKLIVAINEIIADGVRSDHLATDIASERSAGEAWTKAYMDFADGLIRHGKNPDDEANYAAFYSSNGGPRVPVTFALSDLRPRRRDASFIVALSVGIVVVPWIAIRWMRRVVKSRAIPRQV